MVMLQDKQSQGECVVMLLFCICTPIAISWFFSFIKILFSGKEWPSFLTFLFVSSQSHFFPDLPLCEIPQSHNLPLCAAVPLLPDSTYSSPSAPRFNVQLSLCSQF